MEYIYSVNQIIISSPTIHVYQMEKMEYMYISVQIIISLIITDVI